MVNACRRARVDSTHPSPRASHAPSAPGRLRVVDARGTTPSFRRLVRRQHPRRIRMTIASVLPSRSAAVVMSRRCLHGRSFLCTGDAGARLPSCGVSSRSMRSRVQLCSVRNRRNSRSCWGHRGPGRVGAGAVRMSTYIAEYLVLVSSSVPGHAVRLMPSTPEAGTVEGKHHGHPPYSLLAPRGGGRRRRAGLGVDTSKYALLLRAANRRTVLACPASRAVVQEALVRGVLRPEDRIQLPSIWKANRPSPPIGRESGRAAVSRRPEVGPDPPARSGSGTPGFTWL